MQNFWIAMGFTVFAGLSTGIGSIIAFTAKRTNYRFLSVSTGFSAGVMIYVSFVEILFKGSSNLVEALGSPLGHWLNIFAFFGGMLLAGVIDAVLPPMDNPHEVHSEKELAPLLKKTNQPPHKLLRMGLFTALAIAIHNFPEGAATFLAALQNPMAGAAIAVALALHNIPEGISVSVPIYYATGSRKKALWLSFLSGLAEPVGAMLAYGVLMLFATGRNGVIPPHVMGIMFGGVAGIMVYISVDQLLPTSKAYGRGHDSLLGFVGGMFVMAISLVLMK